MTEGMIYGIHPVSEALKSGRAAVGKVLVAEGKHGGPIQHIIRLAREKDVPVHLRPLEVLTKTARTEHHQGIVAFTAGLPYTSWDNLLQEIRGKKERRMNLLLLDSIEDPQNFGSLIRTAEACGITAVVIPKDRAVGLTPAVVKSSAGAAAHMPVVRVTNLVHSLEELKEEGFWIVGADSRAERSLYDMKFDMNVALVIGSEGKGIRPLVLKKCDFAVRIPMKGKIASLNAAVSGAVILFEILRQNLVGAIEGP